MTSERMTTAEREAYEYQQKQKAVLANQAAKRSIFDRLRTPSDAPPCPQCGVAMLATTIPPDRTLAKRAGAEVVQLIGVILMLTGVGLIIGLPLYLWGCRLKPEHLPVWRCGHCNRHHPRPWRSRAERMGYMILRRW